MKLRLKRMGRKKRPFFRIVAADTRSPRDGRFIEELGHYDPLADPMTIMIKEDRALYWLKQGAIPSDTVKSLLKRKGIILRLDLLKRGLDETKIEEELKKWEILQIEKTKRLQEKKALEREKAKSEKQAKIQEEPKEAAEPAETQPETGSVEEAQETAESAPEPYLTDETKEEKVEAQQELIEAESEKKTTQEEKEKEEKEERKEEDNEEKVDSAEDVSDNDKQ